MRFAHKLLATLLLCVLLFVQPGAAISRDGTVQPSKPSTGVKGRLELALVDDSKPTTPSEQKVSTCLVYPPYNSTSPVYLTDGGSTDHRFTYLGKTDNGDCGVRVQPVTSKDDGEWKLRLVYLTDKTDVIAKTTVSVYEYSGGVGPNSKPSVDEEKSLDLILYPLRFTTLTSETTDSEAMSSCAAVTPSGKEVVVAPEGQDPRIVYIADTSSDTLAKGWCAVRIKTVTPQDHGLWVLEATDNATQVVFRGSATVNVNVPGMQAVPETVMAQVADTVAIRMQPLIASDGKHPWVACEALGPNNVSYILAGTPRAGDVEDPRVQYFGGGLDQGDCGMKLQLAKEFAGKWRINATRASSSVGKATAYVTLLGEYVPSNGNLTTILGKRSVAVSCGPQNAVSCRLTDPSGEVTEFSGPCSYTIDNVRAKHAGKWTCTVSEPGYLLQVTDSTQLLLADDVHTVLGVGWREDSVLLTCRVEDITSSLKKPSWCRLEQPGGAVVLLQEGVISVHGEEGRYSYAGEGFDSYDCSMTISTPLTDADKGVWRCTMGSGHYPLRTMGGLISVIPKGSPVPAPKTFPLRTPLSGAAKNESSISVGCGADRPLAYCWLRSPSGELIMVDDYFSSGRFSSGGSGLLLGECVVDITKANSNTDSGRWICGMGVAGQAASSPDLHVNVDMIISNSLLAALTNKVPATQGHWAVMGCNTVTSESVKYCRFQRPDGLSINVADDTSQNSSALVVQDEPEYRYSGSGLHNGSCGLLITSVQAEDFGTWTCSVGLAGDINGREQSALVTLEPAPSSGGLSALMIGVAVGLVLVGLVVGGVVGYRLFYCRQHRYYTWENEMEDVTCTRRSPTPQPLNRSDDSPRGTPRGTTSAHSRWRPRRGRAVAPEPGPSLPVDDVDLIDT